MGTWNKGPKGGQEVSKKGQKGSFLGHFGWKTCYFWYFLVPFCMHKLWSLFEALCEYSGLGYPKGVKKGSKKGQKRVKKGSKMAKNGHFLAIFWSFLDTCFWPLFYGIGQYPLLLTLTWSGTGFGPIKRWSKSVKKGDFSWKMTIFWSFLTLFCDIF